MYADFHDDRWSEQNNFRIYNISNDSGIDLCALETYLTGDRHNNSLVPIFMFKVPYIYVIWKKNLLCLQQHFQFHTTINCDDETII